MQVNEKICNSEYRDCIKGRRDKIGITRNIMMHQVLYNVHVTLFIGQLHNNYTSKLKILQIIMWNIGMAYIKSRGDKIGMPCKHTTVI